MASKKKTEANRKNAQKSTGPRSARGKSLARFNAIKTGVFAMQPLLVGEDENERAELAQQLMAELAPKGTIERMLVDQIIGDLWRLKRVEQAESAYFTDVMHSRYGRVFESMSDGELESLRETMESPDKLQLLINKQSENRARPARTFTLNIGRPIRPNSLEDAEASVATKTAAPEFSEAEAKSARQKFEKAVNQEAVNIGDGLLEALAPPDREAPYGYIDRIRRSLVRDILQKRHSLAGLQEERSTIEASHTNGSE